jgi:hypothetical protein
MTTLQERLRGCADSYTPGYIDDTCEEAADRIDELEAQVAQYKADAELMRAFITDISKQKPEKPDYWSSCGQCENNIDVAEGIIDAAIQNGGDV